MEINNIVSVHKLPFKNEVPDCQLLLFKAISELFVTISTCLNLKPPTKCDICCDDFFPIP